jgi:hypothetical protein
MNAEYIAKSLEAITIIQDGETTVPLQEFADFIRKQNDRLCLLENIVLDFNVLLRKAQEK